MEVVPLHLNYTLFSYKKNILSRLRTCTLLKRKLTASLSSYAMYSTESHYSCFYFHYS